MASDLDDLSWATGWAYDHQHGTPKPCRCCGGTEDTGHTRRCDMAQPIAAAE